MTRGAWWWVDLCVLISLAVLAVAFSLFLETRFLTSTMLFLGAPSLYLIARGGVKRKEVLASTVLFGLLYCFMLDYLAELGGAWSWRDETLVFTNKILGVVTPDAIIWTVLWALLIILYYEHMLDHSRRDVVSPRVWFALIPGLVFLAIILVLHYLDSEILKVTYAYLVWGLCALPPLIFTLIKKPRLLIKFLKAAAYFIPLYVTYELTGLALGQWDFPGTYIGTIHFGELFFPVEEFLFWIVLSSIVVLSYYELYVDDMR